MKSSMEFEILEQPKILGSLISRLVVNYCVVADFPVNFEKIKIIASGSSYNCARIGQKFFEEIAGISCACEFSGEFNAFKKRKIRTDTLYIFISQSGETSDTVEAAEFVKQNGAKTFALVNNENSKLWEICDWGFNIDAGRETAIAATKSYTACVLSMWLFAIKVAQSKAKNVIKYIENIYEIEKNLELTLDCTQNLESAANYLSKCKNFPIIGYGCNYIVAREGALKIKETSYIDVNAYSTGEFVHGHFAILNTAQALVEIFTSEMGEFEIKTLKKIKNKYNPKTIIITDFSGSYGDKNVVTFPKFDDKITKILALAIILQLLALKIAQKLKRDVDKPIGLSKVVE